MAQKENDSFDELPEELEDDKAWMNNIVGFKIGS